MRVPGTGQAEPLSELRREPMFLPRALALSALLHAVLVGSFTWLGAVRAAAAESRAERDREPSGALAGDTFEVDAVVEAPRGGDRRTTPTVAPSPAAQPQPSPAAEEREASSKPDPKAEAAPAPPPKRKKRPRTDGEQRQAKTAEPAASSAESEPGARPDADQGTSYGAAGLPPGVRHLATAFTHAISAATNRDPLWDTLPIGSVGKTRVVIDVDDDGRITHRPAEDDATIPPPLEKLVANTLRLLRAGRFALSRRSTGAGSETFEIEVTLSMVTPPEGNWDDPSHTAKIGYVPPEPGVPGRAFFLHASGRRFDARVTILTTKQP